MDEKLTTNGDLLKMLNYLSKRMSEVVHEIMGQVQTQLDQFPLASEADHNPSKIKLVGQNLSIDRIMIPLNTRPRTYSLLQAFFDSQTMMLEKGEILEAVYGPHKDKSERFMEAQDKSLTKLLSRTRHYLEVSLSHSYHCREIDWLVFDIKTKKYQLYLYRKWEIPTDKNDEMNPWLV